MDLLERCPIACDLNLMYAILHYFVFILEPTLLAKCSGSSIAVTVRVRLCLWQASEMGGSCDFGSSGFKKCPSSLHICPSFTMAHSTALFPEQRAGESEQPNGTNTGRQLKFRRTKTATGSPHRDLEEGESSEGGGDSRPLPGAAGFHLVGCAGTVAATLYRAISYVDLSQQVLDLVFRYLRDVIPKLKPMGLQGLCRIQCLRLMMVNRSSKRELHCFALDGVHLLLMKCIRSPEMRLTRFHNLRPPNALNLPDDDVALVDIMRRWFHQKNFFWVPAEPQKSEKLLVASIVYHAEGDIRYITQGMMQLASRAIRDDLATIRETHPATMGCAGIMLNRQMGLYPFPLFTNAFTRRSRSIPLVRASEPAISSRRRSHSADELDTHVKKNEFLE